jgi:hypothetical protein
MNAIGNVFNAFSNLAASVNALASVIDLATGRLRQQLALDGDLLILPHDGGMGHTESDNPSSNGSNKCGTNRVGVSGEDGVIHLPRSAPRNHNRIPQRGGPCALRPAAVFSSWPTVARGRCAGVCVVNSLTLAGF